MSLSKRTVFVMGVIYIIILLLFKLCKGDMALKHVQKSTMADYRQAPKTWHVYIKAMQFKIIKTMVKQDISLPIFLSVSVLHSHSLKHYSCRNVNMSQYKMIRHPGYSKPSIWFHYVIEAYSYHINWTSGQIYLLNPTGIHMKTYLLFFTLNSAFTLNTTVYTLNFFRGQHQCDKAALLIKRHLSDNKSFSFCGYYSNFNFYSTYSKVVFDFRLYVHQQLLPFIFNASFAVIDKKFVIYIKTSTKLNLVMLNNLTISKPFHNYRIQENISVLSFFIKANKIYQIVFPKLYILTIMYFIFDGSGFTSPILLNEKYPIITSTFQCILQLWLALSNMPITIRVLFHFQPHKIDKSKIIHIIETMVIPFNLLI